MSYNIVSIEIVLVDKYNNLYYHICGEKMGKKVKREVIIVNDVMEGYSTLGKKIRIVMRKMRKKGILGKEIFSPNEFLMIPGNFYQTDEPYSFRIFLNGETIIILEFWYNTWSPKDAEWLKMTIINPNEEIIAKIRNIIRKFPVKGKNYSEKEYFEKFGVCPICGAASSRNSIGGRYLGKRWKEKCPNCGWELPK